MAREKPYIGARVVYRGEGNVRVRTPVSNCARDTEILDAERFKAFYGAVEEHAKQLASQFKTSLELRMILDK